ncbi:MAG: epoxyqueuosine reductase QueH [candidate division WOR-3 bacterium]|nr:epoxyqueuosine reductase QueH [candidate division WOR-3 bacterium]MCX7836590.1 epoxyqueuosine reductase QueH [candidate division WOR-3 bacterium]MDW8114158.1 epoxyqueuosine reductase QueH [candidate division WOR-3 bacterium]
MENNLLLHTCCAICLLNFLNSLKDNFKIILFYYNPNIHPFQEYEKRLKAIEKISRLKNLDLIIPLYTPIEFLNKTKEYRKEKEGGKRCEICFQIRIEKTAQFAKENNFLYFSTTLITSPQKDKNLIDLLANKIAKEKNINYFTLKEISFIKKEEIKKLDIYSQKYCGCIYSIY